MEILAKILIAIVALEHLYIMYFEIFAWETIGKKNIQILSERIIRTNERTGSESGIIQWVFGSGINLVVYHWRSCVVGKYCSFFSVLRNHRGNIRGNNRQQKNISGAGNSGCTGVGGVADEISNRI